MTRQLAAVVVAAGLLSAAVAAPIGDQHGGPQPGAAGEGDRAGGVLQRALRVDTEIVRTNPDLPLEANESAETAELPPLRQPAARRGIDRDVDTLLQDPQTGARAAAAAAAGRPPEAAGRVPAGVQPGGLQDGTDVDRAPVPGIVREAARFLREHRLWLLGGVAVGVLALVCGAAWRRLQAATPERRVEERLPQRSHRSDHRGSRRRSSRSH